MLITLQNILINSDQRDHRGPRLLWSRSRVVIRSKIFEKYVTVTGN